MKEEFLKAIKENKIIVILLIVCVVLFILSKLVNHANSTMERLDAKEDYVYTKESYLFKDGKNQSTLPVVNLNSSDAKTLNQEFEEMYQDKDHILLNYSFQVTNDLLSVAYCKTSFLDDTTPIFEIKTAVFSLKSGKLLSTDEILKRFNITKEEAWKKISTQMESYYNRLVEKGSLEKAECDFSCFRRWKKWTSKEPLQLYVEENSLSHFQSWTVYMNDEMEDFQVENTKFLIVEEA